MIEAVQARLRSNRVATVNAARATTTGYGLLAWVTAIVAIAPAVHTATTAIGQRRRSATAAQTTKPAIALGTVTSA